MFKVFMSIRNRLAITKKCVQALYKHSSTPFQLFCYDNLTHYQIKEHFAYFRKLYEKGFIVQVTFNTSVSTFNAFSKVVASNQFGLLHEQDPNKDNCEFLLLLDNDIIVAPDFDKVLKQAWKDVRKMKLKNVKVIGQLPGGIKQKVVLDQKIAGFEAKFGKLGGSGLWSVRPNFFRDVGFLDVKKSVDQVKRHDQEYWNLLDQSTSGKGYILGLRTKLGIHCGKFAGSICNVLSRNRKTPNKLKLIEFEKAEEKINSMSFDEFYKKVQDDKDLVNDW